ncbi:hypothetical protein BH24BAC1_BH24BAC1_33340 [soil metagenome]
MPEALTSNEGAGQKKLELYLYEPTENITMEMFLRRYRVDPKVFIEKVKGMELGTCKLLS